MTQDNFKYIEHVNEFKHHRILKYLDSVGEGMCDVELNIYCT